MGFKKSWKKFRDKFVKPVVGAVASAVVFSVGFYLNPIGTVLNLRNIYKTRKAYREAERQHKRLQAELAKVAAGTELAKLAEPNLDLDWLAGGKKYNACFAGGALFNPSGLVSPHSVAFGINNPHENDSEWIARLNAPYENLAGGVGFMSSIAKDSEWQRFVSKNL